MKKLNKPTRAKEIQRVWHLIDVKDKVLGRASTEIALLLMGKAKPYFVKNLDCGDFVVVINAYKVSVTGKKEDQKTYDNFSGYPGGRKVKTFKVVREENPERIIRESVSGMLPKNKLRSLMLKRLFVFKDEKHDYEAKFIK